MLTNQRAIDIRLAVPTGRRVSRDFLTITISTIERKGTRFSPQPAETRAIDKDERYKCEQQFHLARPHVIYFGMSRRQIVCPHVRSATENSVVTSDSRCTVTAAATPHARVSPARDQIASCVSPSLTL